MAMYQVFVRTWWKPNKDWPGGLEPHAGRKKVIGYAESEVEAQGIAINYNRWNRPGRLSKKAEYTSDWR
jgi:hypothetical protein